MPRSQGSPRHTLTDPPGQPGQSQAERTPSPVSYGGKLAPFETASLLFVDDNEAGQKLVDAHLEYVQDCRHPHGWVDSTPTPVCTLAPCPQRHMRWCGTPRLSIFLASFVVDSVIARRTEPLGSYTFPDSQTRIARTR